MTKQNISTLQIAACHDNLESLLLSLLERGAQDSAGEERELSDFGAKYKVLVATCENKNKKEFHIELRVSLPGWSQIREVAHLELQNLYGDAFSEPQSTQQLHCKKSAFNFMINVNQAATRFCSNEECARTLAKIRVQAAGAPIFNAMSRLTKPTVSKLESVCRLEINPRFGTCHCLGTLEK